MLYKKTFIFLCLLIFNNQLFMQSFVTKKKKTPSVSALKTNCCDSCIQLLEESSELMENIINLLCKESEKNADLLEIIKDLSKLQRLMIAKSKEILENDTLSFFAKADKKSLQACIDKTTECQQLMKTCHQNSKKNDIHIVHNKIKNHITYIQDL